jgi:hypothetical protein
MKKEAIPLLEAGIHAKTLEEAYLICVESIENNQKRKELFALLKMFLAEVKAQIGDCEIWIDGSFLTQKVNPNDIDVVIYLPSNAVFAEDDVLLLLYSARTKYQCDAYIVENSPQIRSYWGGWMCFVRQEHAKGIIKVQL